MDMITSLTEKETEFYQLYQKEAEKCHTLTTQMEMLKQQLSGITESTIDKKLEEFQKALYRHQVTTPDIKVYDTDSMKQFVNKNSPGLFQDLLTCVTGSKNLSDNRRKLQEQRVVALLHILAYFRYVLRVW